MVRLAKGHRVSRLLEVAVFCGGCGKGHTWTNFSGLIPFPTSQPGLGLGFRMPVKVWTPSGQPQSEEPGGSGNDFSSAFHLQEFALCLCPLATEFTKHELCNSVVLLMTPVTGFDDMKMVEEFKSIIGNLDFFFFTKNNPE